jgi:hypothetical protein
MLTSIVSGKIDCLSFFAVRPTTHYSDLTGEEFNSQLIDSEGPISSRLGEVTF